MTESFDRFTVLHISDVHACETGRLYGSIDGAARLKRVGEYAKEHSLGLDAVVITGDLIQRHNTGAYPAVERACRRIERLLDVPVITVLGNHDDPDAARALTSHAAGHIGTVEVNGYRIVRLDSGSRELGAEQLDWLRLTLKTPAPRGSILALHHAPVGSPMPTLRQQGLADAEDFMDAIAGTDVRAVLAGHLHHSLSASIGGIPVLVAPALAYHQVMHAGPDEVAGHDASWCSLVQFGQNSVVSTPLELRPGKPVFTLQMSNPQPSNTH